MAVRARPHLIPGSQRANERRPLSEWLVFRVLRSRGVPLAIVFGLLYLATALWLYIERELWVGDAVSRTANATYVLFSRDPHLGAIGFVWLPSPSVVQLPLILLLRPLGLTLFAGNVMTVLTASATLWVLCRFLDEMRVSRGWSLALLIPYALNPMTVYYATVGMSESPFVLAMMITIWQFTVYLRNRKGQPLFMCGMALAAAVWTRYEAIPLVLATAIALTLYEVEHDEDHQPIPRTEAVLLTVLGPPVLSFFLWIFFNQIITGDALFFINSTYGPTAQLKSLLTAQKDSEVVIASRSLVQALIFSVKRIVLLAPLFLPIAAVATGYGVWKRDWRLIGVLGIGGSVLVFAVYQLGTGGSFGWLRFFIYSQPLTAVFGVAAVATFRRSIRHRIYAGLVFAMVISIPTAGWAMTQQRFANEEYDNVRHILDPSYLAGDVERRRTSEEIAAYIDALPRDRLVFVETFESWSVAALVKTPQRLVITNDVDAVVFLDDPINKLDYILVNRTSAGGIADQVAQRFPGIYEFGAPWLELQQEWKTSRWAWRLYRVRKGPEGTG